MQQRGHFLGVDAELLGAAAHAHAGALDLEVRIHAYGDARADAQALADHRDALGLGVGLHLDRDAGSHRLRELGRRLTWAGEADAVGGHPRVKRHQHLRRRCDVEGVDEAAQVPDDRRHRVRLDRVTELDVGGQHGPQQLDPLADQGAVVREERRAAHPGGEPLERDAADALVLHATLGDRKEVAHAASSWRIRLRSNLLLGDRGSSERMITSLGTM